MSFYPADIETVNKTARYYGAIGINAIVPRYIWGEYLYKHSHWSVLDYGSGRYAIHTADLRAKGCNVTAWDIGSNFVTGIHSADALTRRYEIIFASNVLNIIPSEDMMYESLKQIYDSMHLGSIFVFNYPKTPRKMYKSNDGLEKVLMKRFRIISKTREGIYVCIKGEENV